MFFSFLVFTCKHVSNISALAMPLTERKTEVDSAKTLACQRLIYKLFPPQYAYCKKMDHSAWKWVFSFFIYEECLASYP